MKRFLIIIGSLSLLAFSLAGIVLVALLNLDKIINHAVNAYGPAFMKTEVRLGDANIQLEKATATFTDLHIGNPQGFTLPELFSAHTVAISFDRLSLLGNPLVIDRLEIDSPEIAYEKKGRTDNFKTLLRNMASPASAAIAGQADDTSPATAQTGKRSGRMLSIREIIIRSAKITSGAPPSGGKSMIINLGELRLHNIGGSSGVPPAEAVRQVLAELYEKPSSPAGCSAPPAGEGGKKGIDRAAESIKKLFSK